MIYQNQNDRYTSEPVRRWKMTEVVFLFHVMIFIGFHFFSKGYPTSAGRNPSSPIRKIEFARHA